MFRVIGCITEQHDLRFVMVAGLLCLFACFTAMSTLARARAARGRSRLTWIAAAGLVTGAGIWGTHFVAMLAYRAGLPVGYDAAQTALSVIIAATMSGIGFTIALSRGALIGGAVTGAAISAMHYVGMSAVRMPALAVWDARYVVVSVIIGIVVTALGMQMALRKSDLRHNLMGAGLLTLAICGMHFTGMAAVSYWPDASVPVPEAVLDPVSLAVAVAAVAVLIVGLGLASAMLDHHLALRASGEAARLRAHVAELEKTKHELETTSHNLEAALVTAASANNAKSQFLAAMSHELRTPLNAVIGFSEMLANETFGPLGNEKYKEYIGDIRTSGVHLLSLINDILDLSRLDAGQMEITNEDVDLTEAVAQSLKIVHGRAREANIRILTAVETPGLAVRGDKRRVRQVLINILANAVKFTPAQGTVRVSIRRDGDTAVIAVADTGIGMAKEDIPKALERFRQVDSSLSRKYEGAGLGLPLARQLMEAHGGRLELDSTLHVGTTVTMLFPAERVIERHEAAA